MINSPYKAQVELLLRVLPYIAKEDIFALKGGTAINLFIRELPRLSVDIDLTYLPLNSRSTALEDISNGLLRIKNDLTKSIPDIQVTRLPQSDGQEAKLSCKLGNAQIKIEVNTTIRGYVTSPRLMSVTDAVQSEFGLFAAINVVSQGELYGGKICAALDRQHPRDLFDIQKLFEHEGLTEEIKIGFIAALLGSNRPINEILNPNLQDQKATFESQFAGMTSDSFSYDDFETTRTQLIKEIHQYLTDDDRKLLLSFKAGEPNWTLYPLDGLQNMPAVKWKLQNVKKLMSDSKKHTQQLDKLKDSLGMNS